MTRPKYEGGLGFRDVELFNLALLARQAWRMLKSSESLSARILKARYFPSTSILDAELGNNPSQIWRAIIEGKEVLKIGLIKWIGDDNTTEIWNQNWLPKEASMRPIPCLMPHRPTLVAELIDPTSARWRQELINSTFLLLDANVILNIPLSTRQYDDFWAWSQEKKGEFTVKACCRMLITTKLRRETWLEGRGGLADSTKREEMLGHSVENSGSVKGQGVSMATCTNFSAHSGCSSSSAYGVLPILCDMWSRGLLAPLPSYLHNGAVCLGASRPRASRAYASYNGTRHTVVALQYDSVGFSGGVGQDHGHTMSYLVREMEIDP